MGTTTTSYLDRLGAPGPKRLLSVDGGGIRGVIALEVLARIEDELRAEAGRPDLVLADVFDYIGGTSTGAIIAAGLSLGMTTDHLLDLYVERGTEIFEPARLFERHLHAYDDDPIEDILREELGATTTFGSERLRTLLLIVLRNASTDSPWPLSNNPRAKFNDRTLGECPLDIPLWQLVRASSAAPTFFPAETIEVGGHRSVFVDGAVTPFNNPAFQLFTMATLDAYGLAWGTGEDELLLVSVGTGSSERARPELDAGDMNLLYHATTTPLALMTSVSAQQDLLCRALGRCRWGLPIDTEVGDLRTSAGLVDPKLFSYLRYDVPLTPESLDMLGMSHVELRDVVPIDGVENVPALRDVGRAVADLAVDRSHFEGFLPAPG